MFPRRDLNQTACDEKKAAEYRMSYGGTGILQSRFSGCKEEDENGSPLTLIEITDSETRL